jgi:hypothetical protein
MSLRAREERRRLLEATVRRQPRSAEAHLQLGSFLWRHLHDYSGAVASYERGLGISPKLVEALNQLGLVHKAKGRIAEAEALFRRAIQIRPRYCRARRNLATLLRERALSIPAGRGGESDGDEEKEALLVEAFELLARTLLYDPYDARGWALLGEWRLALGHVPEAHKCFTKCVSVDVLNSIGYEGLARVHHTPRPSPFNNASLARVFAQTALACNLHFTSFALLADIMEQTYHQPTEALRLLLLASRIPVLRKEQRKHIETRIAAIRAKGSEDGEDTYGVADGGAVGSSSDEKQQPMLLTDPFGRAVNISELVDRPEHWHISHTHMDRSQWRVSGSRRGSHRRPPARCALGHALWVVRSKPYLAGNTWSCDVCYRGISCNDALEDGVYHCSVCEVDVCTRCAYRWRVRVGSAQAPAGVPAAERSLVVWWAPNDAVNGSFAEGDDDVGDEESASRQTTGTSTNAGDHEPCLTACIMRPRDGDGGRSFAFETVQYEVHSGKIAAGPAPIPIPDDGRAWTSLHECLCAFAKTRSDVPLHGGLHEPLALRIALQVLIGGMEAIRQPGVVAQSACVSPGSIAVAPDLLSATTKAAAQPSAESVQVLLFPPDAAPATALGSHSGLLYGPPEVGVGAESYAVQLVDDSDPEEANLAREAALVWSVGTLLGTLLTGCVPYFSLPLKSHAECPEGPISTVEEYLSFVLSVHQGSAPFNVAWLAPFVISPTRDLLRSCFEGPYARPAPNALRTLLEKAIVTAELHGESPARYAARTTTSSADLLHGKVHDKAAIVALLEVHALAAAAGLRARPTWVDEPSLASLSSPLSLNATAPADPKTLLNVGCLWIALSRHLPLRPPQFSASIADAAPTTVTLNLKGSELAPTVELTADHLDCLRQAAVALTMQSNNLTGGIVAPTTQPSPQRQQSMSSPEPTTPTTQLLPQLSSWADNFELPASWSGDVPDDCHPGATNVGGPIAAGLAQRHRAVHTVAASVHSRRVVLQTLRSIQLSVDSCGTAAGTSHTAEQGSTDQKKSGAAVPYVEVDAWVPGLRRVSYGIAVPLAVDWPRFNALEVAFDTREVLPLQHLLLRGSDSASAGSSKPTLLRWNLAATHEATDYSSSVALPLHPSSLAVRTLLRALLERAVVAQKTGEVGGAAHPGTVFLLHDQLEAFLATVVSSSTTGDKEQKHQKKDHKKHHSDKHAHENEGASMRPKSFRWLLAPHNLRPSVDIDGLGLLDPPLAATLQAADLAAHAHTSETDVFSVCLFAVSLLLGPQMLSLVVERAAQANRESQAESENSKQLSETRAASSTFVSKSRADDRPLPLVDQVEALYRCIFPGDLGALARTLARGLAPVPADRPTALELLGSFPSYFVSSAHMPKPNADEVAVLDGWETADDFDRRVKRAATGEQQTDAKPAEIARTASVGPLSTTKAAAQDLLQLLSEASATVGRAKVRPEDEAAVITDRLQRYADAILAAAKEEAEQERAAAEKQSTLQWLQLEDGILKVLLHVEGLSDIVFYAALIEFCGDHGRPSHSAASISSRRDEQPNSAEVRYFGPVRAKPQAKSSAKRKEKEKPKTPPPEAAVSQSQSTAGSASPPPLPQQESTPPSPAPPAAGGEADDAEGTAASRLHSELRFVLESSATNADNVVAAMRTYGAGGKRAQSASNAAASRGPLASNIVGSTGGKWRFLFIHDNDLKATSTEKRRGEVTFREQPESWSVYRRLRWGRAIENFFVTPAAALKLLTLRVPRPHPTAESAPGAPLHRGYSSAAWYFTAELEVTLMRLYAPVQPLEAKDPNDFPLGDGWLIGGGPGSTPDDELAFAASFSQRVVKVLLQTAVHGSLLLLLEELATRPNARHVPDAVVTEQGMQQRLHQASCDVSAANRAIAAGATDGLFDARQKGEFTSKNPRLSESLPQIATWAATIVADALCLYRASQPALHATKKTAKKEKKEAKRASHAAARSSEPKHLPPDVGTSSGSDGDDAASPRCNHPEHLHHDVLPSAAAAKRGKAMPKYVACPELLSACRVFLARLRVALLAVHLEGLLPKATVVSAVNGVGHTGLNLFRCPNHEVSSIAASTGFAAAVYAAESPRPLVAVDFASGAAFDPQPLADAEAYASSISCLECGQSLSRHVLAVEAAVQDYRVGHGTTMLGTDLGVWALVMAYGVDSHPGFSALHGGDHVLGSKTAAVPDHGNPDLAWYKKFLAAGRRTHIEHFSRLFGTSHAPAAAADGAGDAPCAMCKEMCDSKLMVKRAYFALSGKHAADETPLLAVVRQFDAVVAPLQERRLEELRDLGERVLTACVW